eukprot:COSAG01_NODE_5662_length_4113_cov_3.017190_3_plen_78_part_00
MRCVDRSQRGRGSAAFAAARAASDSGRSPLSAQGTVSFCEITNTNRTASTALVIMGTVGQVPFVVYFAHGRHPSSTE